MADLDEATRKTSMGNLVAAARGAAPLSVDGSAARERLATAGLARIERLRVDMGAKGNPEDRRDLIAALMADADDLRAVREAFGQHPDKAEAAAIRLRNVPGVKDDIAQFVKTVRLRVVDEELPEKRERVPFKGHPGPEKLTIPSGYRLDDQGVWGADDNGEVRIATAPVVVTRVAKDVQTGKVRTTVAWRTRGAWRTADVEHGTLADGRKMVALAGLGFPVDSTTSAMMVRYVTAFMAANEGVLPEERVTSRLGWHDGTFMLGAKSIPAGLTFAAEGGDAELAAYFGTRGTWDGWVETMRIVAGYPAALLAVYVSAAAPLLTVIGQQGFVVDWSGDTSRGKTTTHRVAASVWGLPEEGAGLIGSWANASMVGPMGTAALCHSLPVLLDDTKRGNPKVIGAVMYDLPSGQDRTRGTETGGLRSKRSWRTILMSNGEAAITNFNSGAGAAARALCVRGHPMGEDTPANAAAAKAVKQGLLDHYGHLGPKLIAYYQEHGDELRSRFATLSRVYDETAQSAVGHRASAYVAVIHLAAEVCTSLGVPGIMAEALAVAESGLADAEVEADRPSLALAEIGAWVAMSRALFYPGDRPPGGGFIGVFGATHVHILAKELRQRLKDCGFDADSVLESWARRGVLKCDPGKRTTVCRVDGIPARTVAISLAELEKSGSQQ